MKFVRTEAWEAAADALAQRLIIELGKGRVLWLVSGGSNLVASVRIMQSIPNEASNNLSIMPLDERYGPHGHADSNWQQLMDSGFEAKQAKLLPVLKPGLNFDKTTTFYNDLFKQAVTENKVVIGQIGLGPDGHVAGILPNSPACNETIRSVTNYDSQPYKRMTLTFSAIRELDAAYVLAFGVNKLEQLQALKNDNLPLATQPAQILKQLSEAYIYNDQVGE